MHDSSKTVQASKKMLHLEITLFLTPLKNICNSGHIFRKQVLTQHYGLNNCLIFIKFLFYCYIQTIFYQNIFYKLYYLKKTVFCRLHPFLSNNIT